MGELNEVSVSRRDFLKGATAAAVGVAAVGAGITSISGSALSPKKAFAATNLADGTYKVNANLYISRNFVLINVDAYFTNPTNPNDGDGIPSSPNTDLNADLVVANGIATVTVPLINECFMLLSAESGGGATVTATQTKLAKYKDTNNADLYRITDITFELANTNGEYELGDCEEYAAYLNPPFPMSLLVPGYLNWPATLSVDFSTAVAV